MRSLYEKGWNCCGQLYGMEHHRPFYIIGFGSVQAQVNCKQKEACFEAIQLTSRLDGELHAFAMAVAEKFVGFSGSLDFGRTLLHRTLQVILGTLAVPSLPRLKFGEPDAATAIFGIPYEDLLVKLGDAFFGFRQGARTYKGSAVRAIFIDHSATIWAKEAFDFCLEGFVTLRFASNFQLQAFTQTDASV